jgi:hypothetical protein
MRSKQAGNSPLEPVNSILLPGYLPGTVNLNNKDVFVIRFRIAMSV